VFKNRHQIKRYYIAKLIERNMSMRIKGCMLTQGFFLARRKSIEWIEIVKAELAAEPLKWLVVKGVQTHAGWIL
jgi:hypothetical protein